MDEMNGLEDRHYILVLVAIFKYPMRYAKGYMARPTVLKRLKQE